MPALKLPNALQSGLSLLKRLAIVRPKESKLTVGLDIGSSAVKLVIAGPRKMTGARPILGKQVVALKEAVDEQVSSAISEAINAVKLPIKAVNLSVSGQWVIMRVVEMPILKPAELVQALPFEAQRYLPFNVQEVVLDGAILGPAEANKLWVLIVACKRDLLERRIHWIQQAGLEPAVVDVDALALANVFLTQADSRKLAGTHALVNVGAQWTNLVVLKNNVPYLVRDIPWGAEKFTRHLAEQLGLEASAVATQLQQDGSKSSQLLDAMKVTCEALSTELQLSFDFFESRFGPPPDQLLISGGLSQCPGFLEALKGLLPQPMTGWSPREDLPSQFTVAYGLALRGASPA